MSKALSVMELQALKGVRPISYVQVAQRGSDCRR